MKQFKYYHKMSLKRKKKITYYNLVKKIKFIYFKIKKLN